MRYLHRKSTAFKTRKDNEILVKPFPGTCAKAVKHYVNPDLGKSQPSSSYLVVPMVPLAFEYHRENIIASCILIKMVCTIKENGSLLIFFFWNFIPTTLTGIFKDLFLTVKYKWQEKSSKSAIIMTLSLCS